MDPSRPRSELRTFPSLPPHHILPLPSSNYVFVNQTGDTGGGVAMPLVEQPYYLHGSGANPDYSFQRESRGMFLQPQLDHQLPPNVQPPPRSILINPQPRLHYHQYDNNLPPQPLQMEQLNGEQEDLSTEDFIYQRNTEDMINDSVGSESYLTSTTSSMSINDAHLQHQQPVSYSSSSDTNMYNFPYNRNHCETSIPLPHPPEGVLDLSKADALTLTQQFKEEGEVPPSPLSNETQYQQPHNSLPVPFDLSQGQQASVIVHTANVSPNGGVSININETEGEECGAFRILSTSSTSSTKDSRIRAFQTNRPSNRYLHAYHFGNPPNVEQQPIELQDQYSNIMSGIPGEQKPMLALAANHLTEPTLNYNTFPVTSSPQQLWNGGYAPQNQLIGPTKSHQGLHSSNASQSLSAIINMNNQLSQRHFSENSVVNEQLMHDSRAMENHYNTPATTIASTNFSPGTQQQMMHEDVSHVRPTTSTPGPSPKKARSPRNSGGKMGRGRGIKKFIPGSPDVTAPFQNPQNNQSISGYSDVVDPVEGNIPKKGRGRGKKVVANVLNISCTEIDFGTVPTDVNNELQHRLENDEVLIKKKRPYKKRAPKSLNNSVAIESGVSPAESKLNKKIKSEQLEPADSQQEHLHLPNFDSITRGVLKFDNLSSPPLQMNNMDSTGGGKGRGARGSAGRGSGVRKSVGEGRGRGKRRSIGEGRGLGSHCPAAPIINGEMMMKNHTPNVVGMVIPPEHQVPWVGPPPGFKEFSVDGIAPAPPNNHIGLHQVNQPKPLQQIKKKPRVVIVGGKPLEIPEKNISKTLPVSSSVITSNQVASTSAQAQMAETGELPLSSADKVSHSRFLSAKSKSTFSGQQKSLQPKVRRELYQGSDDEIDSNAEDEDDDDDYEYMEKRQRTTRRKSERKQTQPQVDFSDKNVVEKISKQETLYFTSLPSQMNGPQNEMPVSVADREDPVQQLEAQNSSQKQQINIPTENTGRILNVKQENVEVEGDSGPSEMQVDTEGGTFGEAESGLVTATLDDVKPAVRNLKVKNRRLLPSAQRQLKRPIKPRIPMRESLAANFTSRVEKRGRKKKSVDHEEIVVKTEKIESKPRELVEKTETKLVVPKYTDNEKQLLYADKRFVIEISSVDKEPDQIFIWQILRSENCLRQYYPSKYGEKQFFISSPVKWYFFEEEFNSEEFHSRFLPIVVSFATIHEQSIVRRREVIVSEECTVQYVYMDRPFFGRVLKCIAKIHATEELRCKFMSFLSALTYVALEPFFFNRDFGDPSNRRFLEDHDAWKSIKAFISNLLEKVFKVSLFQTKIVQQFLDYPSLTLSTKDVNKTGACSACHRSVPWAAVKFPTRGHMEKPYDMETLIELPPENFPDAPTPMNFCRSCSIAAKKLHRIAHFPYHLLKLIKQNVAQDVATFQKFHTQISDEILTWIQRQDVSWRNVMFLEFQVVVAEVQAEFFARSKVVVDTPTTTTPTPLPNPVDVVPDEI